MTEGGIYLLGEQLKPVAPGVLAELYLTDERLAGSYFDSAAAAAERFVADPFAGPARRMFRTGELVRESCDGLITPVRPAGAPTRAKELAQIEFALANYSDAHHVAVAESANPDRRIAAYVAVRAGQLDPVALHAHATALLPERLVPAALAVVSGLPLAAGPARDGEPAPDRAADDDPPRVLRREALRALFIEVLGVPTVGIQDSFLDLGGQSVTAMLLVSRVNAAMGVDLSIADLFNSPTVAELEQKVRSQTTGGTNPFDLDDQQYTVLLDAPGRYSLWPAAVAVPGGWRVVHGPTDRAGCLEYVTETWTDFSPAGPGGRSGAAEPDPPANTFPLSFNQEFFCELDEGDRAGSFSDRHTLVNGWRLRGPVEVAVLQRALDDVVERHEILRTEIARDCEPRHQIVHPPSPARLRVRDLPAAAGSSRELRCEELLTEVESESLDVRQLPLLRAVLGRFDDQDSVLVLAVHHIAIDGWSMQVLIRDLATRYAARRGFDPPRLPEVHQYREYCVAQRADADSAASRPARAHWREKSRGARMFEMPTHPGPVPAGLSTYAMQSFVLDGELARSSGRLAKQTRSSPFMVLLSAFYLLAHELTGATDLVVPTFTTGRYEARFRDTVGPFLNFLPVRTDIAGSTTFRDVVTRTRASCVEAYAHDIPFECLRPEAPQLFEPVGPGGTPIAFEMVQSPAGAEHEVIGDVSYAEVHRRMLLEGECPDIPHGMLWVLNHVSPDEVIGTIQFKRSEFAGQAVADLVTAYRRLLWRLVSAPDDQLGVGYRAKSGTASQALPARPLGSSHTS